MANRAEDLDVEDDHHLRRDPVEKKPPDQLPLHGKKELNANRSMSLNASDPNVSHDIVRFNYEDEFQCFTKVDTVDGVKVHFSMTGILVDPESKIAQEQEEKKRIYEKYEKMEKMRAEREKKKSLAKSQADEKNGGEAKKQAGDGEQDLYPPQVVLKNQFNYSSRATQTFNQPMRRRALTTLPPPLLDLTFDVTRWDIFDTYLRGYEAVLRAKEEREKAKATFGESKNNETEEQVVEEEKGVFWSPEFLWATKLMERMVCLNCEEDKFVQYKAKRTPSSQQNSKASDFRQLWKLNYEAATDKTVTALCWNQEYTDLVAIAYGSYDFTQANNKDTKGMICIYSLKNPSHPEFTFHTEHGVMCLDFNAQHPSLLCVGLYDGTVMVFDVSLATDKPTFQSLDPTTQHTDPVWEVRWQKDQPEKNLNFFSVSSDGRVTNWIMNKNELMNEECVELKLSGQRESSEDEDDMEDDTIVGLAGGSCMDFNPTHDDIFIVGTEEGDLFSFSKAYNSQFLRCFQGHNMAVYRVLWNPYHPGIFLSCSADWTVKLWDQNHTDPVMTFDLGCSVADVAWAPFKSTVFAVGTADCKVRIFDLSVDKHSPISTTPRLHLNRLQPIHLTHLCFNPDMALLAVGFDNGAVSVIKLTGAVSRHNNIPLEFTVEQKEEEVLNLDGLLVINDNQGTVEGEKIRKLRQERREKKEKEEAAAKAQAGDADNDEDD